MPLRPTARNVESIARLAFKDERSGLTWERVSEDVRETWREGVRQEIIMVCGEGSWGSLRKMQLFGRWPERWTNRLQGLALGVGLSLATVVGVSYGSRGGCKLINSSHAVIPHLHSRPSAYP